MAKKDGALFSRSLFGYKKSDVNEYIRRADAVHSNEIIDASSEKRTIEEKLADANARIAELEATIIKERAMHKESVNKLNADFAKNASEAAAREKALRERLAESEARVASYLKLADTASSRADSAEAEVSVLCAGLDATRADMRALEAEIEEKKAEIKRLTELRGVARSAQAQRSREVGENNRKNTSTKRPGLKWFK